MMRFYSNIPSLDLHGMDRDYARILINEFIDDHYKIGDEFVIIIHGNGSGVIKRTTQEVLSKNKFVNEYKIDNFNTGQTIIKLKNKHF